MQTFLPYSDLQKSAESLDKKRAWKQVVEAKQILGLIDHVDKNEFFILDIKKLEKRGIYDQFKHLPLYSSVKKDHYKLIPHINHPAVKMWVGHNNLLKHYFNVFLQHCLKVHKINTKMEFYNCKYSYGCDGKLNVNIGILDIVLKDNELPWWFGQEQFHRSHRARLIEKDREFYLPKFPEDEKFNDGKYWWPVMESKTFKII